MLEKLCRRTDHILYVDKTMRVSLALHISQCSSRRNKTTIQASLFL
ncbi:hypothetical protein N665_0963s0001 [Sinapis alba]|nr:hypothetical protein N665_0963s0001 [Sinapis alba]